MVEGESKKADQQGNGLAGDAFAVQKIHFAGYEKRR